MYAYSGQDYIYNEANNHTIRKGDFGLKVTNKGYQAYVDGEWKYIDLSALVI